MLQRRVHLIPCFAHDISEQSTTVLPIIGTDPAIPAMTTYRCTSTDTLQLLHEATNDFCARYRKAPAMMYVAVAHVEQMRAWGFHCYYAAKEPQSGYQEVSLKESDLEENTAVCIGGEL